MEPQNVLKEESVELSEHKKSEYKVKIPAMSKFFEAVRWHLVFFGINVFTKLISDPNIIYVF